MQSIPDDVLEEIKACHVTLKGPTHTPEKGDGWPNIESANVSMRKELDLFANVRPVRIPKEGIDWTFFRREHGGPVRGRQPRNRRHAGPGHRPQGHHDAWLGADHRRGVCSCGPDRQEPCYGRHQGQHREDDRRQVLGTWRGGYQSGILASSGTVGTSTS